MQTLLTSWPLSDHYSYILSSLHFINLGVFCHYLSFLALITKTKVIRNHCNDGIVQKKDIVIQCFSPCSHHTGAFLSRLKHHHIRQTEKKADDCFSRLFLVLNSEFDFPSISAQKSKGGCLRTY